MPRLVKIFIATALIGALAYLLGWSSVFTVKRVEYNGITDLLQISVVEKRVGDLETMLNEYGDISLGGRNKKSHRHKRVTRRRKQKTTHRRKQKTTHRRKRRAH